MFDDRLAARPMRVRFNNVEIDFGAYELRRAGESCPVEPQVFELLGYLIRNAGRLVTKDELIESVWNGRIVSDATLASRIRSARRAIGDDGDRQEWIRTVHGRGVCFTGNVERQSAAAGPVSNEGNAPTAPESPDTRARPSIAVLPFATLDGETAYATFADGVAEEITTALSRMRSLIVIARSSAQRYRDQPIDLARVRQELGVRYLVEGSVRRSSHAIRIAARLIQAASGAQVWADHYEGTLDSLFDLEDRIALDIVAAIAPAIRDAEIERARRKQPGSLIAYDCVMRALPQVWSLSREGSDEALRLTAQAVSLEPSYALAYALGAWCQFWRFVNDWGPSREETRAEGARLAREALRLDSGDPDVLTMVSAVEMVLNRDVEAASMQITKALALNPNSAWGWIRSAYMHIYRGDAAPALQDFARAERLSPFDPMNFNRYLGTALAHFIDRRYEVAVEWAAKAVRERPQLFWGCLVQAAAHGLLGNNVQATAAAAKVRTISPAITIAGVVAVKPFAPDDFGARFAEGLRRAGLPEGVTVETPTVKSASEPRTAAEKPAIAVLPFANISGEVDQEYFSDGLTEDLIAALAQFRWFPVIARNSTFSYKGQNVDVKTVARELGVRYVLEGSVRRHGAQFRVAAQLIDGETGHHLWTERFDRQADDIFALQDELARRIAGSIAPELERVEISRTARRRPSDLDAWHFYLRGMAQLQRFGPAGNAEARALFEQAVALDPGYSDAYAGIAVSHNRDLLLDCAVDRSQSMAAAMDAARRAVALDPSSSIARAALSTVHQWRNEQDLALAEAERALSLNPNDAQVLHALGNKSDLAGDGEGIAHMEQAQQLNPQDPDRHSHLCFLARAYINARRYDAAIAAARAALQRRPDYPHAHFILAIALGHLGRTEEAHTALARCEELQQGFLAGRAEWQPYADAAANAHLREGLRRAGLAGLLGETKSPSIAVLPFISLSGDPEQEYFSDGLTEDIITDLSRISSLSVATRNSAFALKGAALPADQAAQRLGVRYVLAGSVRRSADRIRVTAQLIDGRSGGHIWAERYDRDLADIFALQDDISRNIVDSLRVKLLPGELDAIRARPTSNPEAYQYYLMGRSFFLRTGWGQRAMQVARQMFAKAAGIDPQYARAYAGMANCDSYLLCMGDAATSIEGIRANCARALALEPNLADAHAANGLALFTLGETAQAEAAFARAMKLAPDSFEAHFFAGRCARAQGRHARAAELFETAAGLQPDDFRSLGLAANCYHALGRTDAMRDAGRRCLERIEAELALHADDAKALAFGASILAELDDMKRARAWAERAAALDPTDFITNYNLACANVALGDFDAAIERLRRMRANPPETRGLHLDWMQHDSALTPLHGDPRYQALVDELRSDLSTPPMVAVDRQRTTGR